MIISSPNYIAEIDRQDVQEKRKQCSVSTIDSGEVSISSEYNEEYDDWYGGEGRSFIPASNEPSSRACTVFGECREVFDFSEKKTIYNM